MNDPFQPSASELLFVALGGAGEIGMNLSLYGHAGKWLMIDLGIAFGDETTPGVEVIMPDPSFIEERADNLAGLVLTHAHEDHIGAVPYLWPRLRCPIYATPFTASVLRRKLEEAGLVELAPITTVPMSGQFEVGPFSIELITLTHSIPEPNAVVVRSPMGAVLHTGDWKLDPEPLIGETTDEAALRRLGRDGVVAMICDSTNVFVPGQSGSESDVRRTLLDLVGQYRTRIAIACFASNVARLRTIAEVAARHNRRVALVGRSLWRMVEAARENGYLDGIEEFVTEHDVGYFPRDGILLICTGSQGEPRSALARIARDEHPNVVLEGDDVVIFSSRVIPGNEKAIAAQQNALAAKGIRVVTDREEDVHVSGHPARGELASMYQMVRPRIAIPVHGEARHIKEHVALARACQVPQAVETRNGLLLRIAPGEAEIIAEVQSGRIGLDGRSLIRMDGDTLRLRHRMAFNGLIVVAIVLDHDGQLMTTPRVSLEGLLDSEADSIAAAAAIAESVTGALESMPRGKAMIDDEAVESARLAARRWFHKNFAKKPVTKVQIIRL